jgi:predicted XRE-type DNA-binding protein
MTRDRDKLSINVAKLYYRSEYSQQRIAEELGISRPSVSRLLQYAKDKGYSQAEIAKMEKYKELEDKRKIAFAEKMKKEKHDRYDAFYPGEEWLDTSGDLIQAHAGQVFYEDGLYYWYGENKEWTVDFN